MSEQQEKKPNIFLRLLAFLVTLALILGALALVVYRDRLNLDAVKRWLSFRKVETGDTGEAAPFTHAGGDKLSVEYLEDGVVMTSASGVSSPDRTGASQNSSPPMTVTSPKPRAVVP